MGEQDVSALSTGEQMQAFTEALLDDVRALERMQDEGLIESGIRRVGAEQEMFLVNEGYRPAPLAIEALELINDDAFTTELARYNLEANLPVYAFETDFLSKMEADLRRHCEGAFDKLQEIGCTVLLTGILPTLRLSDLGLDNMTPMPRYYALNDAMVKLRGGEFETRIKGIDELYASHDNVMLESCNTSFQLHFQVGPEEFAPLYNIAQAITAPLLAAAVNSPVLLGHRLWHETRVALFTQSVDARNETHQIRGGRPRVDFGSNWVKSSIMELFREDIARFRTVIAVDTGERSTDMLDRGEIPTLDALRLHNGTVYRWNRPCYGAHEGVAHIRIENRILPAGPTIADEMANTTFFYGLMTAATAAYGDITQRMSFADAKANFLSAARLGLHAQFTWVDGRHVPAKQLILEELIPMARDALIAHGIDAGDVNRNLDVLAARVECGRTGAQWALDSLQAIGESGTRDERMRVLTAATVTRQRTRAPVHTWDLASRTEVSDWRPSYETVDQFMTTDVFTLRPEDIVDLAASVMDWERIRHIPVEDDDGKLVGLLTHRTLVRLLAQGYGKLSKGPTVIRDVMKPDPVTVPPGTKTIEAMQLMRQRGVGCLPIVDKGRLVGVITERDLIDVSAQLLEEHLREAEQK